MVNLFFWSKPRTLSNHIIGAANEANQGLADAQAEVAAYQNLVDRAGKRAAFHNERLLVASKIQTLVADFDGLVDKYKEVL